VITATVVHGRVEKDNRNSRSLQAVLDPGGYLQHQHGLVQIDGPSLRRPPSSPDPNAASSFASLSSSVRVPPATDSHTGRGKTSKKKKKKRTQTLRRYNKQVMNKNEHDQHQKIAAAADTAGTSASASGAGAQHSTSSTSNKRAADRTTSTSVLLPNKLKSRWWRK